MQVLNFEDAFILNYYNQFLQLHTLKHKVRLNIPPPHQNNTTAIKSYVDKFIQ